MHLVQFDQDSLAHQIDLQFLSEIVYYGYISVFQFVYIGASLGLYFYDRAYLAGSPDCFRRNLKTFLFSSY